MMNALFYNENNKTLIKFLAGVTAIRVRPMPNGCAVGLVEAPVRTNSVPALLKQGGRSATSKNVRDII